MKPELTPLLSVDPTLYKLNPLSPKSVKMQRLYSPLINSGQVSKYRKLGIIR